jgi:kynurenine formamidase
MTRTYSNWGRWGPDDELGTLNFITKEQVATASRLVKSGEVFGLAIPFDANGPQNGGFGRFNPIHLMLSTGLDALSGELPEVFGGRDLLIRGTDDLVIMPLQCATQWDSLAHIIHDGKLYNGYSAAEVTTAGARRNGIDKARDRIAGRGILLDVARAQGRRWLEPGEGITASDLDMTAEQEGVNPSEGDIVLVRTGQLAQVRSTGQWGSYAGGAAPGLALGSVDWLWRNRIAAVATDTWGVEVRPNETPAAFQPLHIITVVYMGLLLGEIFDLEALAEACAVDGRYAFVFSALPLPITGAVGSPINPVVIR